VLIAKILLLAFDEKEEEIIDAVMSVIDDFGIDTQLKAVNSNPKLLFHGLYIDEHKWIVVREENEIELTYTEFEILLLLARNAGIAFSKEQIYDSVWKEPYFGDYNIVMSHIRNIRKKIEDNPSKPIYIQTVWGVGYKFNNKLK
jgi:DNA-binding response OmpR family regulator